MQARGVQQIIDGKEPPRLEEAFKKRSTAEGKRMVTLGSDRDKTQKEIVAELDREIVDARQRLLSGEDIGWTSAPEDPNPVMPGGCFAFLHPRLLMDTGFHTPSTICEPSTSYDIDTRINDLTQELELVNQQLKIQSQKF
ncbi:hypothetical protein G7K_1905-t1 [Saitoella complicata NRRL Y-17804]|uniref:Uncharacterized protein n=1 Tax=Saitoella complicata (strain BCRC 22490 / CBS 7301 / JCM 7358 / NBRC 10748 / NRRL Y-17804) TaxID=698492 RepID=A0A0E9NDB1_SAICN|nr:hypothetical protein G7K_1905-t1 [Saitoella complicata NRRL Y-17804]